MRACKMHATKRPCKHLEKMGTLHAPYTLLILYRHLSVAANVPLPLVFCGISIYTKLPNVPECALVLGLIVPLPAVVESAEKPPLQGLCGV